MPAHPKSVIGALVAGGALGAKRISSKSSSSRRHAGWSVLCVGRRAVFHVVVCWVHWPMCTPRMRPAFCRSSLLRAGNTYNNGLQEEVGLMLVSCGPHHHPNAVFEVGLHQGSLDVLHPQQA